MTTGNDSPSNAFGYDEATRVTVRHPLRAEQCVAIFSGTHAMRTRDLVAWLATDDAFGPWLDSLPIGFDYEIVVARTGVRLAPQQFLSRLEVANGEVLQVLITEVSRV
jgi:hypothetical protein